MLTAIWLLPLLGFLINSILVLMKPKEQSAQVSGGIASGALFLSFVLSVLVFFQLHAMDEHSRVIQETLFQWISLKQLHIPFVLRADPLTSLMMLIITGIGFLIHVYSMGYMSDDATPGKFFCYLNLFCFAMLALVMGGNLPIMFLGWEGVGLCSYLLIGYWYEDPAKAAAGMKAFVVNRIGDLGFLVGIFLLFFLFGTLDFEALRHAVVGNGQSAATAVTEMLLMHPKLLTVATLCLFVGAMGKSAQIPLFVWLPDAMAGPTPVSALIHAATMVTAGVYMICRLNFLFTLCPLTLNVVSGIGAATALFAATIAIVQTDIKKVLAYSTVSQLGYMFVAVGVGAYGAGFFHVMTHAFFKALLFLGSGSVIHGMHHEQDITKMGGLSHHMPKTFATFAIGTVAIAGIPPLAGFWSKDEILWSAFSSHHGLAGPGLWAVGALTAFLTAFYMTRLTCLTFLGKERFEKNGKHAVHPHESPNLMVIPLMILAVLSIFGGFLGIPHHSWLEHWLAPVVGSHSADAAEGGSMEWILMGVSSLIAVAGVASAYYVYVVKPEISKNLKTSLASAHGLLTNKYYIDEIYDAVFVQPLKKVSVLLWKYFDVLIVDGFVVGLGRVSRLSGEVSRLVQSGAVQLYAVAMLLGLGLILGYLVYGIH